MRFLRRWRPLILLVASWLLFMYYLYRDDINSTTTTTTTTTNSNNNDHIPPPPEEPQPPKTPGRPRPATGHHDIPDVEDIFKNGPAEHGGQIGADHWWKLPRRFPVTNPRPLPQITAQRNGGKKIPKIQTVQPAESQAARDLRLQRQAAVRSSFLHSWSGYKRYAWMSDEVKPLTGNLNNPFGGWAATLVDALDSLWIMGLIVEFEEAVKAAETIDFTRTTADRINVFETTIRYMGGFLSAYELSGKQYESLLQKAREVGELLICAFDTENHMPIARWDWKFYMTGHAQSPTKDVLVSELGSLTLEFTKLSQLTGDTSYYDAVQRISDLLENEQFETKLPGLWPVTIGMKNKEMPDFYHEGYFSLGGMADSLYEYFPKQYLLLGGALEQPRTLYENFLETAKLKLFKRVSNPDNRPIVMSGDVKVKETNWGSLKEEYINRAQHLTCFAGGMVALAAKVFDRPGDELELAAQLTDGCVWAYESLPTGLMPELFRFAPCGDINETQTGASCAWDEQTWRTQVRDYHAGPNPEKRKWDPLGAEITTLIEKKNLVPGFLEILDKKYILRPEAIESVFIMYRLTGEVQWMDKAWRMFEAIEALTRTEVAAAGVREVTVDVSTGTTVDHLDTMESFWLAETLKYFYLVFSEWDLVDLDVWVLNTEAHPLRRLDVAW